MDLMKIVLGPMEILLIILVLVMLIGAFLFLRRR